MVLGQAVVDLRDDQLDGASACALLLNWSAYRKRPCTNGRVTEHSAVHGGMVGGAEATAGSTRTGSALQDGQWMAICHGEPLIAGEAPRNAPELPQPPAKALAVPTTLGLNMQELQNWQHTKQASAKPMAQRVMMNVAESVTMDMQNTVRRQMTRVVSLKPQQYLPHLPRRTPAATACATGHVSHFPSGTKR